jgi:hypothetical protein
MLTHVQLVKVFENNHIITLTSTAIIFTEKHVTTYFTSYLRSTEFITMRSPSHIEEHMQRPSVPSLVTQHIANEFLFFNTSDDNHPTSINCPISRI